MTSIIALSPENYDRHPIHGEGRRWAETNCYVDVLIELIHALGFEPTAALSFTVSVDFEVDQWTFFKFAHEDLLSMYGMHVQELNPWMSLARHVEEQVNNGRAVLVEVDSFFLPDTIGTAYRANHVKSTVAVNEIDIDASHMGYFHGQGYYQVEGKDFDDLFQTDGLVHDRMLPPYIELVKIRKTPNDIVVAELLEQSICSLVRQLRLLPTTNPFDAFTSRFEYDLEWLRTQSIESFHQYSFATLRQYGACFELLEGYLSWLRDHGETGLSESIRAYGLISETAKVFQFKLARSLSRKKTLDLDPIKQMGDLWQNGADILTTKYL